MQYYLKNVKDVLTAVCSEEKGLTQGEAEKRLARKRQEQAGRSKEGFSAETIFRTDGGPDDPGAHRGGG